MKPWTAFSGIAKWVLRIAMLMVVFTQYYDTFMHFNLNSLAFYFSVIFIVFGVLLIIGGFLSKPHITVISALFLLLAFVYMSIISFDGITEQFALNVLGGAVALLFVAVGNK